MLAVVDPSAEARYQQVLAALDMHAATRFAFARASAANLSVDETIASIG